MALCEFKCGCEVGEAADCGMCCPEAVARREARFPKAEPAPSSLASLPLDDPETGRPPTWSEEPFPAPESPSTPAPARRKRRG